MHLGAHGKLFEYARQLRQNPTPAEQLLWERLRGNQTGYKFRRQHPMDKYVVDFYCLALKLAIEIDGPIHLDPIKQLEDENKDIDLTEKGIEILRFTNEQVIHHMETVIAEIIKTLSYLEKKYRFM